jgi:hypothetical protein
MVLAYAGAGKITLDGIKESFAPFLLTDGKNCIILLSQGGCMGKKGALSFGILVCAACFAVADSGKGLDYLAHCNFAFGFSYSFGGNAAASSPFDIALVDGFGDSYHFTSFPSDPWLANFGFNLTLSFPFYYHQYFSVGASGMVFLKGLTDESPMYYSGGLYAEGIYNKFSLRLGASFAWGLISEKLSPVVAAWPGDPGFYNGKDFLNVGDPPVASSNEYLGIAWSVTLKYYPFKVPKIKGFVRTIHFQLGYTFIPEKTLSDYKLELAKKEYNVPGKPEFKVDPVHNLCLLLGFGL